MGSATGIRCSPTGWNPSSTISWPLVRPLESSSWPTHDRPVAERAPIARVGQRPVRLQAAMHLPETVTDGRAGDRQRRRQLHDRLDVAALLRAKLESAVGRRDDGRVAVVLRERGRDVRPLNRDVTPRRAGGTVAARIPGSGVLGRACSGMYALVAAIVIASGCGSNPSGPTTIARLGRRPREDELRTDVAGRSPARRQGQDDLSDQRAV